jgi:hypothetical protein
MIWCITATIEKKTKDGVQTSQVPTFFLDDRVQGIMGEGHAKFIGAEIINPMRLKNITLHVSAIAADREVWAK